MLKNTYNKHPGVIFGLCAAVIAAYTPCAFAVGLGQVRLESALGQPLRASIPLIEDAGSSKIGTCFNARLSSADGAFIVSPKVSVTPGSPRGSLSLSTTEPIGEPGLTLVIEMACGDGLRREFSLLLDPPINTPSSPVVPLRSALAINNTILPIRSEQLDNPGRSPRPRPQITKRPQRAFDQGSAAAAVSKPEVRTDFAKGEGSRTASGKTRLAEPAKPVDTTPRNVLQLGSSDPRDNDLVNAIGLRLARANSVEAAAAAASMAKMEDPAKAAAARAAQAQFAAILRDEPVADIGGQGTSQKLEQLIAKMSLLEAETEKLRKSSQRDAAALKASQESGMNGILLPILATLFVLSLAMMAWLVLRLKYLKRQSLSWNWDEKTGGNTTDTNVESRREGSLSSTPDTLQNAAPSATTSAKSSNFIDEPHDVVPVAPKSKSKSKPGRDKPKKTVPDLPFTQPADMAPFLPISGADEEFGTDHRRVDVLAVEEISDVMQEAEFWISLHDGQRAIEVLEPYATLDHPASPLPWLYLFDLYAEMGQQAKYEILHERFMQVFNSKIPTWDEHIAGGGLPSNGGIESVPHILNKIYAYWQTEQIVPYLESLLLDDRDGARTGFDLIVYREIMFLIGVAYELQQSGNLGLPPSGSGLTLVA